MIIFLALFGLAAFTNAATPPADATNTPPFFMFAAYRFSNTAEGEAVRAVLRQYFTSRDYIGSELGKTDAKLAGRVEPTHIFTLPASIEQMQRHVHSKEVGLVIYDIEHWSSTPREQQKDPVGAIQRAAEMIRAAGPQKFGVTPDGLFLGLKEKSCDISADACILRRANLEKVDLVMCQAQRLLSDRCAAEGGVDRYVTLVSSLAKDMKARNPKLQVIAQVSFRYAPPARMIEALRRVQNDVDGFYFAYPAMPGKVSCEYCSAERLRQVFEAFRSSNR